MKIRLEALKKIGKDKVGRQKIKQLIQVLKQDNYNMEDAINKLVDLNSFYRFWAMEGLLGFWDGYSGNSNNFFIYFNLETDKFHFIPWRADSLFERFSPINDDKKDPVSVKTKGLIAHKLYQLESGRQRYGQALKIILEKYWNEKELLLETKRVEELLKPYLSINQSSSLDLGQVENKAKNKQEEREVYQSVDAFAESLKKKKEFIRKRRIEIMEEIAEGMPKWNIKPQPPFLISSIDKFISFSAGCTGGGCVGFFSAILVNWLINR